MPAPASNRIFLPGNRYLVAYLAFLGAFAPLSTDLYLPALPGMAEALHTTDELVGYSMSLFFLVYALSSLIWGPLSDKFGRKPILLAGSIIYMASSVSIALTDSIWTLLVMRCLQASGCAAASSMSLAITKDVMRGRLMERIMSFIQAAHVLAPLTAPLIGGAMLLFTTWRGIFWALVLVGLIALVCATCLSETGRPRRERSLLHAYGRIRVVLANTAFLRPWLLFSAMTMPFMSYLVASSFVYQVEFQLSAQEFSLYFALNALFSLAGPLACLYFFSRLPRNSVIACELATMCLSGCLLLAFGRLYPWLFALFMIPLTFCGAAMRPPSTIIMMNANRGDNGTVAALIQCGALLFAGFSMLLALMSFWHDPVTAIGTIAAVVSGTGFLAWLRISKRLEKAR